MALRKASRPLKFKIVDQRKPWKTFGMLIYGEPGSGKTHLASTAVQVPEMCNVLLIDNDGGSRTVRGKSEFEGLQILSAIGADYDDYTEILKWLNGTKTPYAEMLNGLGDPKSFKTVIIDNIGAMQWVAMQNIIATFDHNRTNDEAASQQDYGILRSRTRNLFRIFSETSEATGITFIFTAHSQFVETLRKVMPALDGRSKSEVPGDLPLVAYLGVSKPKKLLGNAKSNPKGIRVAHFDSALQPRLVVKDQSDVLGSIERPTMKKIFIALHEKGLFNGDGNQNQG